MEHFKRKVDAGADYVCTQVFFDNNDFYHFRERCDLAGIRVPIVAGIVPIISKAGMVRMAELALGRASRRRCCEQSADVQMAGRWRASASTGKRSNAAICWRTTCAASTFTR